MEQGALIDVVVARAFDHQYPGGERRRHGGFVQCPAGEAATSRGACPDRREMALARPLGADQGNRARRPMGPAFDQLQGGRIARPDQEILAGKILPGIEREAKPVRT